MSIAPNCKSVRTNHIVTGPEVVVALSVELPPDFFKNGKENKSRASNRQSRLESFQDFLIEVDMKQRMHLVRWNIGFLH